MSVSIRKVEEPVYDGSTGAQTDTHVRYELGGEIDGTFIPFANVRESFVGHLQRLDKEQQAKSAQQQGGTTTNPAGEQAGQNIPQAQTGTAGTPSATSSTTGAPQSPQVPTEPQQSTGETAESQ